MHITASHHGVLDNASSSRNSRDRREWWQLASARIAIGFVIWSALWVVLSDAFLHHVVGGPPSEVWPLETLKGLIYVTVTGIVLFFFGRAREREYFAAHRTTENRLRRMSESNLIAICYWKPSGEITDANNAFLGLLGCSRQELLNRQLCWRDFTPQEYLAADSEHLKRLLATGGQINYEKEFLRKDGSRVSVLVGSTLLDCSKARGVSFVLDMSELKRAEEKNAELENQLRQSQKLEAVGQLASGIAHDFNNLLNIMIGYTCLIEAKVDSDALRENAKHILNAAAKATGLIRKLLAFGRKQHLNPELLNINSSLREYEHFIPRLIGESIRCELQLSADLWAVKVDRNQLEQVIVNLIVNARDAMPYGGTLTIATANDEQTDEALLTIRDTGIGMTEETKSRIFDPFFTTKPNGQGSGLGLSTVHGIVAQSGGRIMVSTELGHGTSFCVSLPRAADKKEARSAAANSSRSKLLVMSRKCTETVLLAEDEPDLRELLANMLRMQGYRVIPAKDGEEAVALARTHHGPIDLFLTDIVMPHMNGIEAADVIAKIRPNVSVLCMTGYAEQTVSSESNYALLEKPVSPPILFQRMRDILDSRMSKRTGSC